VLWATYAIRNDQIDIAVVGASDAPMTEFIFSMFCAGGFLSEWDGPAHEASRPYDLLRSGLVLGEGSAALIVESLELARSRGARIYCEIVGVGSASEGALRGRTRKIYQQGLERAIRATLSDAQLVPADIDHVHAHGNSTRNDDAAETEAYKTVFGEHASRLSITSIKGCIGQPLAAGGVLQLASLALSTVHQQVPPTANLHVRDPECDLDYVAEGSRVVRLECALAHSHSLGAGLPGTHNAVIIRAAQPC